MPVLNRSALFSPRVFVIERGVRVILRSLRKCYRNHLLSVSSKLMKTDECITFEIRFEKLSASSELNRGLVGRLKQ